MGRHEYGTLSAGDVTTVTLDADYGHVEICNRDGAAEIFFSVDGSDPVVEGDFDFIPAALDCVVVQAPGQGASTVVKLISSGAPTFAVRGY